METNSPASSRPIASPWSGVLAGLCFLLAMALPMACAAFLLHGWPDVLLHALAQLGGHGPGRLGAINGNSTWLPAIAALGMGPVLLTSAALWRAGRCLRAFARSHHFTLFAVKELRGFAALMCCAALVSILSPTVIALLPGPGPRSLVLSLGSQQFLLLLFSALTWQIAAVLAHAVTLADEHAQIV